MKIAVIPDTQVAPDTPMEHLAWAGKYLAKKKPDVIVMIGDWFDMPSLSTYDRGKKSFEGRRYKKDIEAGKQGMELFMRPIIQEQDRLFRNHRERWKPRLVFTLGNHCYRIERAIEADPMLEGLISYDDLGLETWGWEVYPFLEVVVIEGIAFSHYFTSGIMGRPVTNARLLLQKKSMSCVQGHLQDRDIAYGKRADGKHMTGLMAGIFYQHQQAYLTPQTNGSWAGIWLLHNVDDGYFDEVPVPLEYLRRKYG